MEIKTLPLKSSGHKISNHDEVEVLDFDERGPFVSPMASIFECSACGQRPELKVDGDAVHAESPCPYPDGITTTINVAFTSGKIIVTDDLRPAYDWDPEREYKLASYNSALGQHQAIEAMAKINCAYGPVGDSCPGLYRTAPGEYIVASPGCDDDDNPLLPEEACLASICTDLWAYSIADLEHWKARGGDPDSVQNADIIDFQPGIYQFTHHTGELGFDHYAEGTVIFAHVERIG